MIAPETAALFFVASLALAIAPGPDNLFVLVQAALGGPAAGLFVTLGLCTGLVAHTLAVALGVAAIFQTSDVAFTALKSVGAVYLLYLAWQALRAEPVAVGGPGRAADRRVLYRRGVIMNISNPKVAIFFLAFLPQFADPVRGSVVPQIVVLGGLFIIATLLVFGALSWAAGSIGRWLHGSAPAQRNLNRVAAAVFVGLAIRLAVVQP